MMIKIDFSEPVIKKDIVMEMSSEDLDDFYASASDFDKSNIFFILLASLHYYEESDDVIRAAHLSFLTAYYVFMPLTPPGSHQLALHYIKKAVSMNPLPEYEKWLSIMEKGN